MVNYTTFLNKDEDTRVIEASQYLIDNKIIEKSTRYAIGRFALLTLADLVDKWRNNDDKMLKINAKNVEKMLKR